MANGTIKRLMKEKGFGFIRPARGAADLFFHRSAVSSGTAFDNLSEGDAVSYEEETSSKGPRAVDVRLA